MKDDNDSKIMLNEEQIEAHEAKENEFRKATKTTKSIYTCIVSTFGIKQNEYSKAILSNAHILEDLFV